MYNSIHFPLSTISSKLSSKLLKKPPSPIDWMHQSYMELIQDMSFVTIHYYESKDIYPSCGREGHSRRSHSGCLLNTTGANNTSVVICPHCGGGGHSRRNHQDCTVISPSQAARTNNASVVICPHCGGEGHSRRNHRDCAMNLNNLNATAEVAEPDVRPNPVICPFCGREGHSRRTHGNCAMNSYAHNRASDLNITLDPELPEVPRNSVGAIKRGLFIMSSSHVD
ncbi:hypothetical protein [Parasitella parasitica]|uniref:CCHC-type domain-containing protein n=1 Tax=Parasitella parasitica TaxID=35722 RepID=A0A0B7N7G5_9FUNG|nr:hypothetical protein [Parasitella parasitica]